MYAHVDAVTIDNILNRYIKYIYIYCKMDFEIYLYIVTNTYKVIFS